MIDLAGDAGLWASRPATSPDPQTLGLTSRNLAYIIYTSGSTGTPKGVMVEHRNLGNKISTLFSWLPFAECESILLLNSFAFDPSVEQIFLPLCHGRRLVIGPDPGKAGVEHVWDTIRQSDVGYLDTTPTFLEALLAEKGLRPPLKMIVLGGERLGVDCYLRARGHFPDARLINLYGPTEATIDAIGFHIDDENLQYIPLGRPLPNYRVYLLDGHGEPVPLGATGEIYIGGAGVARGYLNRAELTAERFVPSPFVEGDRLYRTGDLARYLPDG
ncbi:AMP-binding protein, partial [Sphingomonas sanguinis]|uniref:AMP-binding protein n=1 Tax=Sphingomonas sanguinis TaxID=33051 RepID=UPI00187C59A1